MRKSIIVFVSILLFSLQIFSQNEIDHSSNPIEGQKKKETLKDIYPEITISPFPIMSYIPPALTKKQLKWFKEAGFNVMAIHPDLEAHTLLKKYWDGNWMVLKDFNSKEYDYKTMCDFKSEDPKRIGFLLGDEPTTPKLDSYIEKYDFLRSRHPDDFCLVNMFPSYVNQTFLGSTYREYMDTYFEKLSPRYASLDNYPCYRFNYEGRTYYHDLEMMRETAQKNNTKIIGFVQVYSSDASRDISESDLAWQVNSLLAYGSKGLWYFYYRHPVPGINDLLGTDYMKQNKKDSVWNFQKGRIKEVCGNNVFEFGSGVLNAEDQKGERYNDVARVNAETLAWGDILIQLKSIKVRHILGHQEAYPPVGTDDFTKKEWSGVNENFVSKITAKNPSQSMGFILSYFEDKQKQQYIMIINKKHGENMNCKAGSLLTKIIFTDEVKNAYLISNTTSQETKIQLDEFNSFEREINGGSAFLIRLELNNKVLK